MTYSTTEGKLIYCLGFPISASEQMSNLDSSLIAYDIITLQEVFAFRTHNVILSNTTNCFYSLSDEQIQIYTASNGNKLHQVSLSQSLSTIIDGRRIIKHGLYTNGKIYYAIAGLIHEPTLLIQINLDNGDIFKPTTIGHKCRPIIGGSNDEGDLIFMRCGTQTSYWDCRKQSLYSIPSINPISLIQVPDSLKVFYIAPYENIKLYDLDKKIVIAEYPFSFHSHISSHTLHLSRDQKRLIIISQIIETAHNQGISRSKSIGTRIEQFSVSSGEVTGTFTTHFLFIDIAISSDGKHAYGVIPASNDENSVTEVIYIDLDRNAVVNTVKFSGKSLTRVFVI